MDGLVVGAKVVYSQGDHLPEGGFTVRRKLGGVMGLPPEYLIAKEVPEGWILLLAPEAKLRLASAQ